ncbi:MAG: aminopeptidase N, partial [Synechococcus sp.]
DLDVQIHLDHVIVTSRLRLEPRQADQPLVLQGVDLELESICIDQRPLADDQWDLDHATLTIAQPPNQPFVLTTRCRLHPERNSSLEGLYASEGMLTTQCEAEGFRRIAFHPDRPDVLSQWTVRIEADQTRYPVLLSNGNGISVAPEAAVDGRHAMQWTDPSRKPSYLFALVAGKLAEIRDEYRTASGRVVALRLHVEPGDEPFTAHAMASLKRSMEWDERVYQLEYDLDEYNIVAVRHFNMGAMENKSLNIFNSKLVLADAETATDGELERVESVIAHEYFHNWTGNRITCRDWFQLSLKEGLTVFRDQSFTADLHSASVKRIEDVAMLRNTQFREDAGPTAHPVKPSEYQAIDNFYTTTIYEKGAELIRMLHTLLGQDRFMNGMAEYVRRFDGTAATTEDFVEAIAAGATQNGEPLGFDLDQFRRWYHQAGTPELSIDQRWDAERGDMIVSLQQVTPPTPGQPEKTALVVPVSMALIGPEGRLNDEQLVVLDRPSASVTLKAAPSAQAPALSVLRGFSAPVVLRQSRPLTDTLLLLAADDDPFSRWDAAQSLYRDVLLARASDQPDLPKEAALIEALGQRLAALKTGQESELATLLSLPGLAELESLQSPVDPLALYRAVLGWRQRLGEALREPLLQLLAVARGQWDAAWPDGQGHRQLTAVAWHWLAANDQAIRQDALAAVSGPSMTLARAALRALQPVDCPERDQASRVFEQRWQDKPVILDAWFSMEASMPRADALDHVRGLLAHPRFDPLAPNSLRAVLGGFTANTLAFHAEDGSGYRFMAQQILDVDSRNPITASRMVKVFSRWRSYGEERSQLMHQAIRILADRGDQLSVNTREVVTLLLS